MAQSRFHCWHVDLWHLHSTSTHHGSKNSYKYQDVSKAIEDLRRDNKDAWEIELENDLRYMVLGDRSIMEYCQKMNVIAKLLANIGSPIRRKPLSPIFLMPWVLSLTTSPLSSVIMSLFQFFFKTAPCLLLENNDLIRPIPLNPLTWITH